MKLNGHTHINNLTYKYIIFKVFLLRDAIGLLVECTVLIHIHTHIYLSYKNFWKIKQNHAFIKMCIKLSKFSSTLSFTSVTFNISSIKAIEPGKKYKIDGFSSTISDLLVNRSSLPTPSTFYSRRPSTSSKPAVF